MHPVIILIATLAGFRVAGFFGAIFAIPLVGILAVIVRELGHYIINREE
jgi:predicted PurR-regulated permease PerM